jgi:KaiC/GvpD/RAD55 family RecA-like ATPase
MASCSRKIKRPFVVSVEGNIGSGKSSFLTHFQSYPGVKIYSVMS